MATCESLEPDKWNRINMCKYGNDYSTLYDFINTRHLMCHSCWSKETHVQIGKDQIKVFREWQLRAVNVVCLGCGMDVTTLGGCSRCHSKC